MTEIVTYNGVTRISKMGAAMFDLVTDAIIVAQYVTKYIIISKAKEVRGSMPSPKYITGYIPPSATFTSVCMSSSLKSSASRRCSRPGSRFLGHSSLATNTFSTPRLKYVNSPLASGSSFRSARSRKS